MIIYLDCNPGDDFGYSSWFEPTWHMHDSQKVLIGSRQAQVEEPEELKIIAKPLKELKFKQINEIYINLVSNDLVVRINDYYLKTFVADPNDEYIWQIRDIGNKKMIEANPSKISLKEYSRE